jgi:hypothetical protein
MIEVKILKLVNMSKPKNEGKVQSIQQDLTKLVLFFRWQDLHPVQQMRRKDVNSGSTLMCIDISTRIFCQDYERRDYHVNTKE